MFSRLPPTKDSAKHYCFRLYHRVQKWLGLEISPVQWGWLRQISRDSFPGELSSATTARSNDFLHLQRKDIPTLIVAGKQAFLHYYGEYCTKVPDLLFTKTSTSKILFRKTCDDDDFPQDYDEEMDPSTPGGVKKEDPEREPCPSKRRRVH